MAISLKYLERRADRLFDEWDAIDDPYGLPAKEFQKAVKKIDEAVVIAMCLSTIKENT